MDMFDKTASALLGAVFIYAIADIRKLVRKYRNLIIGVTDEMIEITKDVWKKDVPTPVKFGELFERTSALGATPPQIGRLNMAFAMNGRQPIEMWKEIIPRTIHIHGKFYGFDENGDEPSIDYATIFKVFTEGGYDGYIASEYEGSAFTDEFDAFDMVAKQHALFKKILKKIKNG